MNSQALRRPYRGYIPERFCNTSAGKGSRKVNGWLTMPLVRGELTPVRGFGSESRPGVPLAAFPQRECDSRAEPTPAAIGSQADNNPLTCAALSGQSINSVYYTKQTNLAHSGTLGRCPLSWRFELSWLTRATRRRAKRSTDRIGPAISAWSCCWRAILVGAILSLRYLGSDQAQPLILGLAGLLRHGGRVLPLRDRHRRHAIRRQTARNDMTKLMADTSGGRPHRHRG